MFITITFGYTEIHYGNDIIHFNCVKVQRNPLGKLLYAEQFWNTFSNKWDQDFFSSRKIVRLLLWCIWLQSKLIAYWKWWVNCLTLLKCLHSQKFRYSSIISKHITAEVPQSNQECELRLGLVLFFSMFEFAANVEYVVRMFGYCWIPNNG